ncbi:unnamed protein product [Polarella glacialis]|uniref:Uncharacterized protein n=1 Tax=Polarella glacialis TaxID=89957 RepID=A0A813HBB6_POLGL|nr:unnamed protein product [Polarella glacialis]
MFFSGIFAACLFVRLIGAAGQALCLLPKILPQGYDFSGCNAAGTPLAFSSCLPQCDQAAWYLGQATASCDSGNSTQPGTFAFSGCSLLSCPWQCGSCNRIAAGAGSGASLFSMVLDSRSGRLLAADAARHVVLSLPSSDAGIGGPVTVLWGQLGTAGNSDGSATSAARLSGVLSLELAGTEGLLFAADTGNGKVRVLSLQTLQVATVAFGFSQPRALVLHKMSSSWDLFVADYATGKILRLPLPAVTDGMWPSIHIPSDALTLALVAQGLSNPGGLAVQSDGQQLIISEVGTGRILKVSLTGTAGAAASMILRPGPPVSALKAVLRGSFSLNSIGPVAIDNADKSPTLIVADSANNKLFAVELLRSAKSCEELGWPQAAEEALGSPRICGRSNGTASSVGDLCEAGILNTGLCCSGEVTYSTAQDFCLRQGARLCSAEELRNDEARDDVLGPSVPRCLTGPSFVYDGPYDENRIWSSSTCDSDGAPDGGRITKAGSRRWSDRTPEACKSKLTDLAYVKCCADRDLVMSVVGEQKPLLFSNANGHALFQPLPAANITALTWDHLRRRLFVAFGAELAVLSWSVPRSIAVGSRGLTDVLKLPLGLAWAEPSAQLLIADKQAHVLQAADFTGASNLEVVAGQKGQGRNSGDGGQAGVASLNAPIGVAMDGSGTVAFVSTGSDSVRRIELSGGRIISTVINAPEARGLRGDSGPGIAAELNAPQGLAVAGNWLFVADRSNQRVRLLHLDTGVIESAAGPVRVPTVSVSSEGGAVAIYALAEDPNVTSARPPRDLVVTSPVGIAASPDGSSVFISEDFTKSILFIDRGAVPRIVKPVLGTEGLLLNPRDLMMHPNGTIFVADWDSHCIYALEVFCEPGGGCRAQGFRRVAGSGDRGDGDVVRRGLSTETTTTTQTFTSTRTTTSTPLACSNHVLGYPGQDCDAACAHFNGTCDPEALQGFNFSQFQNTVLIQEGVLCKEDARFWWDAGLPAFETNEASRNYGWCSGVNSQPYTMDCSAKYVEYGLFTKTMRRWCKCRREGICQLPSTTGTYTATVTTTITTNFFTTTKSTTTTSSSTFTTTNTPSAYRQDCPEGYTTLLPPPPMSKKINGKLPPDVTNQASARACAVLCEVSNDCAAITYDGLAGLCQVFKAPAKGAPWPRMAPVEAVHMTGCIRNPALGDTTLQLLMADWMPWDSPLDTPGAMALDHDRNLLYFCDSGNNKIKVLDLISHRVLTTAGLGNFGTNYYGDGGPARDAIMWNPRGLALDEPRGHLYFTDTNNHVIRRVELSMSRLTGIISGVAGTSVGGDGIENIDPVSTRFRYPWGLGLGYTASNDVQLYVSDSSNDQIWRVDLVPLNSRMARLAGKQKVSLIGDKGDALKAQVLKPRALLVSSGSGAGIAGINEVLFAEPSAHRLRWLDLSTGMIDTVMSTYALDFSRGQNLIGIVPLSYDAGLALPFGVAAVQAAGGIGGTVYVADYATSEVRRTDLASGITFDLAGMRGQRGPLPGEGDGGPANLAKLVGPTDVALDEVGQVLYIADSDDCRVRKVDLVSGIISTVASSVPPGGSCEYIFGLALDPLRQILYVSAPAEHIVYKLVLEALPCAAPEGIQQASTPSCWEGSLVNIAQCTPVCVEGFEPTISALSCFGGVLTPPSFACQPKPCKAPWGVVNSLLTPCEEGLVVTSGTDCTAACEAGFQASANLKCKEGVLQPSTFTCADPDAPVTTTAVPAAGSQSFGQSQSSDSSGSSSSSGSSAASSLTAGQASWEEAELLMASTVDAPVNSSLAFEAMTSGLNLQQTALLAGTVAVQRPLQKALGEVLSIDEGTVRILTVQVQPVRRRLGWDEHDEDEERVARSLTAYSHRFYVVYSVARPPDWVVDRMDSLQAGVPTANSALAAALGNARLAEGIAEASASRNLPCRLPSAPSGASMVPCMQSILETPSGGNCSTRCFAPLQPDVSNLFCFARLWIPPVFACTDNAWESPSTSCSAPVGVSGAADPPCEEMQDYNSSISIICTPTCLPNLVASEMALACMFGDLQPSTFVCRRPECTPPVGIPQAADRPCLEGAEIQPGGQCTASCKSGFKPTANLTCMRGALVPARFACTGALTEQSGGSAADSFWGEGNSNADVDSRASSGALRTTLGPLGLQASPVTPNAQNAEVDNSDWGLAVVVGLSTGAAALVLGFMVVLAVAWRRRRKAWAQAQASWEKAVEGLSPTSPEPDNAEENQAIEASNSLVVVTEADNDEDEHGVEEDQDALDASKLTGIHQQQLRLQLEHVGGLHGPADVKEILGSAVTASALAAAAVASPADIAKMPDSESSVSDAPQPLAGSAFDCSELLQFAKLAAAESASSGAASRDAVFDALDAELGQAVAEAAGSSRAVCLPAAAQRLDPGLRSRGEKPAPDENNKDNNNNNKNDNNNSNNREKEKQRPRARPSRNNNNDNNNSSSSNNNHSNNNNDNNNNRAPREEARASEMLSSV